MWGKRVGSVHFYDTVETQLMWLTSKNLIPGLTMAAIAAADGHIESNCCSVRDGTPVAEQTKRESIHLKCTEHVDHQHRELCMLRTCIYTLHSINIDMDFVVHD